MSLIEKKLKELNIVLPGKVKPTPLAEYVMTRLANGFLFVAGVCPLESCRPWITGQLVRDMKHEQGYEAARIAAINVLAAAKEALGDLDRISSVVKVVGYVACDSDFYDQHMIVNGASHLFCDVFGERGKHVCSAVGVSTLPFHVPVMLEVIFSVDEAEGGL